jgi:hypothetical protein
VRWYALSAMVLIGFCDDIVEHLLEQLHTADGQQRFA